MEELEDKSGVGSLLLGKPSASSSAPGASADGADEAETAATDAMMSAIEAGDRNAFGKALRAFVHSIMADSDY